MKYFLVIGTELEGEDLWADGDEIVEGLLFLEVFVHEVEHFGNGARCGGRGRGYYC